MTEMPLHLHNFGLYPTISFLFSQQTFMGRLLCDKISCYPPSLKSVELDLCQVLFIIQLE